MRYYISILTLLLLSSFTKTVAQNFKACSHSGSRFAVVPNASSPIASPDLVTTYEWIWDESIVVADRVITYSNGDSIDIYWKDTRKPNSRIGYVQKSAYLFPNGNGGFDRIDGCNSDTTWANVNINGIEIALLQDENRCAGDSITYRNEVSTIGSYKYKWEVGNNMYTSDAITIHTTKADTIKIKVTETDLESTCSTSDSTELVVNPLPEFSILMGGKNVKETMMCTLDTSITLDPGFNPDYIYSWNGEFSDPVLYNVPPIESTASDSIKYYTLAVSNGFGCETKDSVAILRCEMKDGGKAQMAITPNGDGNNDTWKIPYLVNASNASVTVYDRWGGIVFLSQGKYTPWNGKFEGKTVPMGTYFYVIKKSETSKPDYGTLLIIR